MGSGHQAGGRHPPFPVIPYQEAKDSSPSPGVPGADAESVAAMYRRRHPLAVASTIQVTTLRLSRAIVRSVGAPVSDETRCTLRAFNSCESTSATGEAKPAHYDSVARKPMRCNWVSGYATAAPCRLVIRSGARCRLRVTEGVSASVNT